MEAMMLMQLFSDKTFQKQQEWPRKGCQFCNCIVRASFAFAGLLHQTGNKLFFLTIGNGQVINLFLNMHG